MTAAQAKLVPQFRTEPRILHMFVYLIPLYLALWVAGVGMHFAYKRRLRALDPELADRLYPGLLRKSIATDFAAMGFLFRGEFRKLNNPGFTRFSELYRVLTLIWFVVFLATMIAVTQ